MDMWVVEWFNDGRWKPMASAARETRAEARNLCSFIYKVHREEGLAKPAMRIRAYIRDPFRVNR